MVAAVRVHKPGGPEVLTYDDVQIAAPGQGQIKIKQHAAGVNFIDAYFRMGMYPSPVGMPFHCRQRKRRRSHGRRSGRYRSQDG